MKRSVQYHPEARAEIQFAARGYAGAAGLELSRKFVRSFQRVIEDISKEPLHFHKRRGEFRAAVMPRFPYIIHFRLEDDVIFVIAVAHGSRRPDYWWDREGEI